jgi:hypothetical protein
MFRSNTELMLALAVTGIGCAMATYFFFREDEKAREIRADASTKIKSVADNSPSAAAAAPINPADVIKAIPASPRKEEEKSDRNAFLVHQMMVDPNFQLQVRSVA